MKITKCKFCGKEFEKINKLNPYCRKMCEIQAQAKRKKEKIVKDKKVKKNARESVSMLMRKADKIFSEYIRRKYSKDDMITCISCEKVIHWKESHNCHWIGRGNKQYRFDEDNCRPGCAGCNTYAQEFHQRIFTIKQIKRLGQETVDIMIDNTKYPYKMGKTELREIIEEYTLKLKNL